METKGIYEVKAIEERWVAGVLRHVAHLRCGRVYARLTQKAGVYNVGKFATGANLYYKHLDTLETRQGYTNWVDGLKVGMKLQIG